VAFVIPRLDAGATMLVGQEFGPFTIDAEIGSGAMGTVYRGRYTKTGQVMAIKIMAPGIGSTNAAAADRFEREIAILKQLNHPNIVRFYGAGKQQGNRYFAMEYIAGESLDKVMARRGRMTWEEVVELGQQLCSALQHAHEKGIVHRDLKPSNVMVLPDGTLKLTDFGIAKATELEALTATNCTVGTASYMSPEQCKGERNLTYKSDLYSLGVMFYELLTGRKPFQADNAMDMFLQHVQGTVERPSRLVLDIPIWLDTLICQLLEKKPEQRPLDAAMVSNTLGTIQDKVVAQQSAGAEAVRRRLMDRAPGQKKVEEEDKEAARLLMTGKGKSKRKASKKRWYQRVWVQALGLMLALGVAGTLIYLAFRPPSADVLYRQAKAIMDSGNVEAQDKALEPDGPFKKYHRLKYDKQDTEQTRQMIAWIRDIEDRQCQQLLDNFMQKERANSPLKVQANKDEEKWAFAAVKAEEDGKTQDAVDNWNKVAREGAERWQRTANKHLAELQAVQQADAAFQKRYESMHPHRSGGEIANAQEKQAFLAWRAEHGKVEDAYRAKSLLTALKEETAKEPGPRKRWYVYAAENSKRLADVADDKKKQKEKIADQLKMIEEQRASKSPTISPGEAWLFCNDVVDLYAADKEMKPLVEKAETLRKEIASVPMSEPRP
jgi:predicted Ser/Thr protein kinase